MRRFYLVGVLCSLNASIYAMGPYADLVAKLCGNVNPSESVTVAVEDHNTTIIDNYPKIDQGNEELLSVIPFEFDKNDNIILEKPHAKSK